jgi:hypothetical protein
VTWRYWTLTVLNLAAFALVVSTYWELGLQKAPLSYRYYLSTLATAVTAVRGIAADGTTSNELSQYFKTRGARLTDEELTAALTIPLSPLDYRIVGFPTDDQGLPRFVEASFALFGVSLSAPHKLFFLVFGATMLLFAFEFFGEPVALVLTLSIVLAFYAFEFVLDLSSQLLTAIDARFMGVLVIVPCLHLCLAGRRLLRSPAAAAAGVLQALVIASMYQIRSSSAWSIVCVIAVSIWSAGASLVRPRLDQSWIAPLATAAIVIASLAAITTYHRAHLAGVFRTEVRAEHVFWHSVHVGLAANPDLAREYNLTFDDLPAHQHVFRHLTEAHDTETLREVFGGDGRTFDYGRISWRAYDRAARTVVANVVRRHPWQAMQAFGYYKPVMFLKTLMWAVGRPRGPLEAIGISQAWVMPDTERRQRDAYLRLLRPLALFLFGAALVCLAIRGAPAPAEGPLRVGTAVLVVMFVCALIPGFLVLPTFHWASDAIVIACALPYMVIAWVVTAASRAVPTV